LLRLAPVQPNQAMLASPRAMNFVLEKIDPHQELHGTIDLSATEAEFACDLPGIQLDQGMPVAVLEEPCENFYVRLGPLPAYNIGDLDIETHSP